MKTTLISTLIAGVMAVPLAVHAGGMGYDKSGSKDGMEHATDKSGDMSTFRQLDSDSDGYLSRSEASSQPTLEKHWKKLDKDQDERLTRSEFSAFEAGDMKMESAPGESVDRPAAGTPDTMQ